jgi:hypothetical protein
MKYNTVGNNSQNTTQKIVARDKIDTPIKHTIVIVWQSVIIGG